MENQRFDTLTRMLASGASRRTVLRGVFGGALAAVGLGGAAAAKANKVDICHQTGNGSYRLINVSANALDAHIAHGDHYPPDTCEENFELDPATCECACPITDCGLGRTFDPGRCTCMCGDNGEFGEDCGEGDQGTCERSIDGGFVCVDLGSAICDANACSSTGDCPKDQVCVRNEFSCGDDEYRCLVAK